MVVSYQVTYAQKTVDLFFPFLSLFVLEAVEQVLSLVGIRNTGYYL